MIYEIPVDYNGSKVFSSIYVKAIAGMAEFDYGNMSGWTYSVNGEFPKCVLLGLQTVGGRLCQMDLHG